MGSPFARLVHISSIPDRYSRISDDKLRRSEKRVVYVSERSVVTSVSDWHLSSSKKR